MLAGNLASIGVGALIAGVSTLIWPDNFDFEITRTQAGVREVIPVEIVDSSAMTEEKGEKVDGTAEELVLSAAASVSSGTFHACSLSDCVCFFPLVYARS